jgi:oxygen-dependent protoporphyrinogen oxidase
MRVAVIGAGVAGLTAAYELSKNNRDVVVFEKGAHLGGRTFTYRDNKLKIDTGAVFFTDFYPLLKKYILELGLSDRIYSIPHLVNLMTYEKQYLFKLGGLGSLLRFPWLGIVDKLKIIKLGLASARIKSKSPLSDLEKLAKLDGQSIYDFMLQHTSRDCYDFLARTSTEPYYYWSAKEASSAIFQILIPSIPYAKFHTFLDGMDTICKSLARNLKDIRLNSAVVKVFENEKNKFTLETKNGNETFDQIIFATPAPITHELVKDLSSSLVSDHKKNFLKQIKYAANINVAFYMSHQDSKKIECFSQPTGDALDGLAALVVHRHKNRKFIEKNGEKEILSAYFLDSISKKMLQQSDEEILKTTEDYLRKFYPHIEKKIELITVMRRELAIPIPVPGHFRDCLEFQRLQSGPITFAGDYLISSSIEGALESGRRAVASLE